MKERLQKGVINLIVYLFTVLNIFILNSLFALLVPDMTSTQACVKTTEQLPAVC